MKTISCIIAKKPYHALETNIPKKITESFHTRLNIFLKRKTTVNNRKVFNFAYYQHIVDNRDKDNDIRNKAC